MTVTITQAMRDISGVADNTALTFSQPGQPRIAADGTTIVTTRRVTVAPVSGTLTVDLEPGPAVVEISGRPYPFTVPDTDAQLWPLISDRLLTPPVPGSGYLTTSAAAVTYAPLSRAVVRAVGTDAGIRAAADALPDGGTILIPAGTITLTAPLPVRSGLRYVGEQPVTEPSVTTTPDYLGDIEPTLVGGTVLVGDGSFAAFEANTTDLSEPDDAPGDAQISNFGIEALALDNFTYGVHIGAKNVMGAVWGTFRDLFITGCSAWGVRLINFQHCQVERVRCWTCQHGQYYGNDMPAAVMMCGNSSLSELFVLGPRDGRDQHLTRGIVFDAGSGEDGVLNELFVGRIQSNQFRSSTPLSVTATLTNASANITVPDGSKFAVGLPVVFTADAGGFTANQTYIVGTVSGNTITLRDHVTASARTATASTTGTLTTFGYPNVEITRQDASASVRHSTFSALDLEGGSSAALLIDGASAIRVHVAEAPSDDAGHNDLVIRQSSFVQITTGVALKTDVDIDSSSYSYFGQRARLIGVEGLGMWLDSLTGARGMSLTGYSGGPEVVTGDGGIWVGRFAEHSRAAGYSSNLDPGWLGHATWGESSPRTMTIVDPSTSRIGDWHQVNAVGSGAVTVNTASGSSPTFNKISGLQSISVPAGSWARFTCTASDDASPFWLVTKGTLATS